MGEITVADAIGPRRILPSPVSNPLRRWNHHQRPKRPLGEYFEKVEKSADRIGLRL